MMLFQTLDRIKEELDFVLVEEGGFYVSVNVFEWEGRGIHIRQSHKNYDVEINLYNAAGERIDNWVTEIVWVKELTPEERMNIAKRQARKVLITVKAWFEDEPIKVAGHVKLYRTRGEIEHYDKQHKRIKTYTSGIYSNDKRKERVL